jgi:hypothetical protein
MSPRTLQGPRSLDVLFGLFLASGVTVGAYALWAVADWIHPQGEKAFGSLFVGALSFAPTLLAWLAGGVHLFLASRNHDVRLGVGLATAHFLWWLLLIGVAVWHGLPPAPQWAMRAVTTVEPGLYAVAVTFLGTRWFWRRRYGAVQVAHSRMGSNR